MRPQGDYRGGKAICDSPPASGRGESPYSFEITSFSDSDATIEARMIAATAERPTT